MNHHRLPPGFMLVLACALGAAGWLGLWYGLR